MAVIHRQGAVESGELRWQDLPVRDYGPENSGADKATRQILIGPDENSPNLPSTLLRRSARRPYLA